MLPGQKRPINQADFGKHPRFFELPHQFLFQYGGPQRTLAAASSFNTASDVGAYMAATESRATCSNLQYVLGN
jgi:hypothetical protein